MPIQQETPESAIRGALKQGTEAFVKEIMRTLAFVGEQAVNQARAAHTYRDQTGNLTASIGYSVIRDGEVAAIGDFNPVPAPEGNGSEGVSTGRNLALDLAPQFPQGMTLVVVAGMKYAKYVAGMGYDVLDSSYTLAKKLTPQLLNDLTK